MNASLACLRLGRLGVGGGFRAILVLVIEGLGY